MRNEEEEEVHAEAQRRRGCRAVTKLSATLILHPIIGVKRIKKEALYLLITRGSPRPP